MFILKALRYGLEPFPSHTSKLAELIAEDTGLDKHTVSADTLTSRVFCPLWVVGG